MKFGVIFDFNGVIVNDYLIQKAAWDHISLILRKKNCSDTEMMRNIRGVPTRDVILWMGAQGVSSEKILEELVEEKESFVANLYNTSPLFCLSTGFALFCDQLKKERVPRTIATSSTYKRMQFAFEKLGLSEWFVLDEIEYYDGTYRGKPAPDAYLRAAKKIGLEPKSCIVFEDASSGIQAAYDAGVTTIVAVGSEQRLQLLRDKPGVKYGIHDFTEIDLFILQDLHSQ